MVSAAVQKCILIVDGNPSVRKIVRFFLESESLRICGEAVSGHDAVEKAEQLKPDLIILEISLLGMNGLRTASILKQMQPETPIVMFTSFYDAFRPFETPAGIDAVVPKTGNISLLINGVHDLLRRSAVD